VGSKKLTKKPNSKMCITDNPTVPEVRKAKPSNEQPKVSPKNRLIKKSLSSKDLKKIVSSTVCAHPKKSLSRVTSGVNFHFEIGKKL
jgi:DNA polymerase III sliding clamp (beta) subunit (PCNA family)